MGAAASAGPVRRPAEALAGTWRATAKENWQLDERYGYKSQGCKVSNVARNRKQLDFFVRDEQRSEEERQRVRCALGLFP